MSGWNLVISGCGTSHGSPPWGWPEQWSEDPRDHRRRSGAIIRGPDDQVLLIDAGPDLMHQMRDPYRDWDGIHYPQRCITRCDAVLLTHEHADHTHGINELRHLNRLQHGDPIVIYGHATHLAQLRRRFDYCFPTEEEEAYYLSRPVLRTRSLSDGLTLELAGLPVTAFEQSHGPAGRTTGFRCGSMGYCTDVKVFPEVSFAYLQDLELLVLGMLREDEHETHMHLAEALMVVERVRPRRTVFVHMGPEMRYARWAGRLPPGVELAYDGMVLPFGDT
ncbi:MAG: MBL fold metallo-hydrolase [Planctomycetota bacterium]